MPETLVGILVGSESDRARMQAAMDELDARAIGWEFDVRSAHRTPDAVAEYAKGDPNDLCIRLTLSNRGPDPAPLHVKNQGTCGGMRQKSRSIRSQHAGKIR